MGKYTEKAFVEANYATTAGLVRIQCGGCNAKDHTGWEEALRIARGEIVRTCAKCGATMKPVPRR